MGIPDDLELRRVRDAEEKARASERRYAALSEITSDGVLIHDGTKVVDCNTRAAELLGYSVAEMIGMPRAGFVAERSRERVQAVIRNPTEDSYEIFVVRKDGSEIEVELTPRTTEIDGKPVRGLAARVLTEQRAKERALEESERRNRALFECSYVAMGQLDSSGRFHSANAAMARFLGTTIEEIIGRTFADFTHDDEVSVSRERYLALVEGRIPTFSLEKRYRRKDSSIVWGHVTAQVVKTGDKVEYVLAIVEDITKRKEAEAERDALLVREQRAKEEAQALVEQRTAELAATRGQLVQQERLAMAGQLAAGVAHEVNNPLAFVISSLEFLQEELEPLFMRLPADQRTELESAMSDAQQGARRIRNIVAELKSFSRQDSDEPTVVNLHKAADFSVAMAIPQIRCRAQLVKEYGEVPQVWATDTKLGQVLLNLLVNAAQAIPEGAVSANTITVKTWTSSEGEAVVEVRDTGAGIAPDKLKRIFEPFFTTKPQGQGTGLGLPICLGIVQSLGGRIDVESQLGVGTSFCVVLPAAKLGAEVTVHPLVLRASKRKTAARVLVVDDEVGITNSVRRLIGHSCEIIPVNSGAAALAAIGGGAHFDLVLCDLMMPELTGVEVYEALQKVRPELVNRFVLMTGGAFTERGTRFLKTGVRQLAKPFTAAQLQALVDELVGIGRSTDGSMADVARAQSSVASGEWKRLSIV